MSKNRKMLSVTINENNQLNKPEFITVNQLIKHHKLENITELNSAPKLPITALNNKLIHRKLDSILATETSIKTAREIQGKKKFLPGHNFCFTKTF